jgi:hypothetical protein
MEGPAARADALRDLRAHAVTPELLGALDDVMRQADIQYAPEVVRLVACHRARANGASLDIAFAGLPTDPTDVAWHHEGAACLVDVVAARAAEDPARATAVLAGRAIYDPTPRVLEGLARLDLPELPEPIATAADDRTPVGRRRRVRAVEAWSVRAQGRALSRIRCLGDVLPAAATVDLASYVRFLALEP